MDRWVVLLLLAPFLSGCLDTAGDENLDALRSADAVWPTRMVLELRNDGDAAAQFEIQLRGGGTEKRSSGTLEVGQVISLELDMNENGTYAGSFDFRGPSVLVLPAPASVTGSWVLEREACVGLDVVTVTLVATPHFGADGSGMGVRTSVPC